MAKYKVSVNCTDYFQELEIEAQDETEAEAKYQDMLHNGEVLVTDSEFSDLKVSKV